MLSVYVGGAAVGCRLWERRGREGGRNEAVWWEQCLLIDIPRGTRHDDNAAPPLIVPVFMRRKGLRWCTVNGFRLS